MDRWHSVYRSFNNRSRGDLLVRTKRPWKERVWFMKPDPFYWPGWKYAKPIWLGDDEYHWRTVVIGFWFTGQVVIATHEFKCKGGDEETCYAEDMSQYPGWPMSVYEWLYGPLEDEEV